MKSKLILTLSISLTLSLIINAYLILKQRPSDFVATNPDSMPAIENPMSQHSSQQTNSLTSKHTVPVLVTSEQASKFEPTISQDELEQVEFEQDGTGRQGIIDLKKQAEAAFQAQDFSDALYYYQLLEEQNASLTKTLNQQWLSQVHLWTSQQQYSISNAMITAFLNLYPFNEQWLTEQINLYIALKRPFDSIESFILLIDHAFNQAKEVLWTQQLHQYAKEQIQFFQTYRQWQTVVDLSLVMLNFAPNEHDYTLALGEAYIYLNDPNKAIEELAIIEYDSKYEDKVAALYQLIFPREDENTTLKLQPYNTHLLIDSLINEQLTVNLIVDTGATLTVISKPTFEQLKNSGDITINQAVKINTAGGIQNAFSITVDSFKVGPYVLNDFELIVIEQESLSIADGLLGMNFFRNFIFEIDQKKALLTIKNQP